MKSFSSVYNEISMVQITDSNFEDEVIKASGPVVVDCYTAWCAPCKILKPLITEVVEANEGVKLGMLEVDNNPQLALRLNIAAVPKVVFFNKGKEVDFLVGVRSKEDYQGVIDELLQTPAEESPQKET